MSKPQSPSRSIDTTHIPSSTECEVQHHSQKHEASAPTPPPQMLAVWMSTISAQLAQILNHHATASPLLMTVTEAAEALRLSERTIRAKLAAQEWPAYRCGSAVRVDPFEIKARMKRMPHSARTAHTRAAPNRV